MDHRRDARRHRRPRRRLTHERYRDAVPAKGRVSTGSVAFLRAQLGAHATERCSGADLRLEPRDARRAQARVRVAHHEPHELLGLVVGHQAAARREQEQDAGRAVVDLAVGFVARRAFAHDVRAFEQLAPSVVGGLPQLDAPRADERKRVRLLEIRASRSRLHRTDRTTAPRRSVKFCGQRGP